jgi:hypothetical protein
MMASAPLTSGLATFRNPVFEDRQRFENRQHFVINHPEFRPESLESGDLAGVVELAGVGCRWLALGTISGTIGEAAPIRRKA